MPVQFGEVDVRQGELRVQPNGLPVMASGVGVPFVRPRLDASGERTIRLDRRGGHIRHLAHRAWRCLHVQSAPDAGRQVVGQGQRVRPAHGLRHADGPSHEILDARIDPNVRARLHNGAVENEAGTGTTRELGQFRAFDPIERGCSDLPGRIAQPFVADDFDIWCLREPRDQHRGQAFAQPRHVWAAGPDDLERHDGHGRSRRGSTWRRGRRLAAPAHGPQDRTRDGRCDNGGADPHGPASPPGGGGFAWRLDDLPRHRLRARDRLSKLAQVDGEITHTLIPAVRILGQALAQYSMKLRAGGQVLDARRRRHLAENRADRVGGAALPERRHSRDHLVQDGAERKDVAARVNRFTTHLLGRHIAHGAHDDAFGCAHLHVGHGRGIGERTVGHGIHQLRHAEVDDLQVAVLRDEQVFGLEVTVNDAARVHLAEGVCRLTGVLERQTEVQRASLEYLAQRAAFDVLHGDVRAAVNLVDVVDGSDVRVVDRRRHACFLDEPLAPRFILRERGVNQLEGRSALQLQVFGEENLSHSALSQKFEDTVVTDSGPWHSGMIAPTSAGAARVEA